MVTLKALEAAIVQVERIRDFEYSFEANDVEITLRPLRPDEETEVQRYAQIAMEDLEEGEATQAAFADFMDRMRHASLAFAIVQIGDLDLRDVEYVETGEQDEQGRPVSVPKWEGLRNMIGQKWTRSMLSQVFARFGELLERVELRASKSVKFDAVDLDEEIARVERRLAELRAAKQTLEASPEEDNVRKQQRLLTEIQRTRQQQHDNIRGGTATGDVEESASASEPSGEKVEASKPAPSDGSAVEPRPSSAETTSRPVGERPSAFPDAGPPPEVDRPDASEGPLGGAETQDQEGSESPSKRTEAVDSQNIPLPHGGDSFFDPTDPDEAMEIEAHRQEMLHRQHILRQRERRLEEQRREALGMPSAAEAARKAQEAQRQAQVPQKAARLDPRTSSLREAANVSDAVFDAGTGSIQSARPPTPRSQRSGKGTTATLHGKPVYKMPPQTLERKEATGTPDQGEPMVPINPPPGSRNERFRGPGER